MAASRSSPFSGSGPLVPKPLLKQLAGEADVAADPQAGEPAVANGLVDPAATDRQQRCGVLCRQQRDVEGGARKLARARPLGRLACVDHGAATGHPRRRTEKQALRAILLTGPGHAAKRRQRTGRDARAAATVGEKGIEGKGASGVDETMDATVDAPSTPRPAQMQGFWAFPLSDPAPTPCGCDGVRQRPGQQEPGQGGAWTA